MAHIPRRTGLSTIRILLRKICSLINKFRHLFGGFMTTEQVDKFEQLYDLCMEIVEIIDTIFQSDT